VAALYYGVTYLDTTQIVSANAPTETASVASFECTVTRERLTAKPVIDYPDEDSARAALEPTLHAWEATTELIDGYPVRFDFEQSQMEVVDPSEGNTVAMAGVAMVAVATLEATATLERGRFPMPKDEIKSVGEMTTLLRTRWRNVAQGRELVTGSAYFVLTTLEDKFGGRNGVASTLCISRNILDKLGRLASTEDPQLGRKASGGPGPLISEDVIWIKAACHQLIKRVMLYEAGIQHLPQITMADVAKQ